MDLLNSFAIANQKAYRQKLRIKIKITLFVSLAAVIFFSSLIFIVYVLGFNVLREKAVESQAEMARTLASAVSTAIEKEAASLKIKASDKLILNTLKENNSKYAAKSESEILRYLMDMDKRWIEADAGHPFLKDYLENPLSLSLRNPPVDDEKIVSVTVTDKFGGLVASTARPSGFYSFDKDWWLSAYSRGHGSLFVGQVEYDQPANLWCLPFSIPVENEGGYAVGVYKALVSLDVFFKPLTEFKIGKTGNAVLVDDKAYLLYHQKAAPFDNKFCDYAEFRKTLQNTEKWGVLDSAYLNHGKTLAAYAEVKLPSPGITWYVFVDRDLREIFMPLEELMLIMLLVGAALTVILALSVFILSAQGQPVSALQVVKDAVVTDVPKARAIDLPKKEGNNV